MKSLRRNYNGRWKFNNDVCWGNCANCKNKSNRLTQNIASVHVPTHFILFLYYWILKHLSSQLLGKDTHCASASWYPWRGPTSSERQKAEFTQGRLETWLTHIPVSQFALIAISVPNESFSIWLHKEAELSPAEPLKRAETRVNSSICFFIVLQNHCQPVTYLSSSHRSSTVVNRFAYRGTVSGC